MARFTSAVHVISLFFFPHLFMREKAFILSISQIGDGEGGGVKSRRGIADISTSLDELDAATSVDMRVILHRSFSG